LEKEVVRKSEEWGRGEIKMRGELTITSLSM